MSNFSVVSLVIRGSLEKKNGLALGKGFKTIGSDTRIIHDITNFSLADSENYFIHSLLRKDCYLEYSLEVQ
jgi:hypothetical protein